MKDIELQTEAFKRYIEECDELSITPDYAGAFNAAWNASAAVEADRAQRVPDWSHPKVQALIGSDARKRIQIDLLWRILENPNDEFGPSDMEYWDAIHDRLKSAMLASTPAPAQQETSPIKAEHKTVTSSGTVVTRLELTDKAKESLRANVTHIPGIAQHQEPPQQERKPMTESRVIAEYNNHAVAGGVAARAGFLDGFLLGVRLAERHHGIKE